MGHTPTNNASALAQGLKWLKEQREDLIELYYYELHRLSKVNGWQIPGEMMQIIANGNIEGLIERLEGQGLKTQAVKEVYSENIKQGAQIEQSMLIMDSLLAVFSVKVHEDLSEQPEVSRVLVEKATYFNTLIKATLATSHIEQPGSSVRSNQTGPLSKPR